VAGVERGMRVVLDVRLDRLGVLPAGDLTGEPQAEGPDRRTGRPPGVMIATSVREAGTPQKEDADVG
jgi:hypothetical protein